MERMHSFDNEKHEERLESMEIERFLLASESQSEVTGISSNSAQDHQGSVTVTILNKGIFFYDTQQCVASLVVPPSLALTGLAVVSADSSELCVSADYTTVMYYRSQDKLMTGKLSYTNAALKESKKPIHSLFPLWSRRALCVVYNDGSVVLLGLPDLHVLAELAADRSDDGVVWADLTTALVSSEADVTLAILKKKKGKAALSLDLSAIALPPAGHASDASTQPTTTSSANASSGTTVARALLGETKPIPIFRKLTSIPFTHPSGDLKPDILSFAIHYYGREIVILWSQQHLCFYSWVDLLSSSATVDLKYCRKLNSFDIPSNKPNGLVSTFLGRNHYVLAGKKAHVLGKNVINFVTFWSTSLGIVESYFTLASNYKLSQSNNISLNPQQSTLLQAVTSADSSRITFAMMGAVIVCRVVHTHTPSLATAVGKFELTDRVLAENDHLKTLNISNSQNLVGHEYRTYKNSLKEALSHPTPYFVHYEVDEELWKSQMENNTKNLAQLFNKLIDSKKTPTETEFNVQFEKFMKQKGKTTLISPEMVRKLASRCLQDHFWPTISYCITNNILSCSMLPNLADSLMENNQINLILEMLFHFDDIPERLLIHFMQFFVSHADRDALIQVLQQAFPTLTDFSPAASLAHVLNVVLNYNFNESIVKASVKMLNIKEIAVLATHITNELEKHAAHIIVGKSDRLGIMKNLPFGKALSWMTVLFDTHFTQFLLVEELTSCVARFQETMQKHVGISENLNFIDSYVSQVHPSLYLPQEANTSRYQFKVLDFPLVQLRTPTNES